jgi:hypothetical protein
LLWIEEFVLTGHGLQSAQAPVPWPLSRPIANGGLSIAAAQVSLDLQISRPTAALRT